MKANAEVQNRTSVRLAKLALTLLCISQLFLTSAQIRAATCDVDPSFDPGSSLNAGVNVIAMSEDGKILIGGRFSIVPGSMCSGLARLNADGSVDDSFLPRLALSVPYHTTPGVSVITMEKDGKILIGGGFTSIDGVARTNLARLNPDGTLDSSFPNVLTGTGKVVNSIALQGDGKILIGGRFDSVSGVACTNLARLNPNGSLDDTFLASVAGDNLSIGCIATQSDSKILIGGWFESVNGVACTNLARLNPDGSLDDSFNAPFAAEGEPVLCMIVQTNGQILVSGFLMSDTGGVLRQKVVRLNADGTPDVDFVAETGDALVTPGLLIALQPDGKILVGGRFDSFNGVARTNLVRLNADSTVDDSFSANFFVDPTGYAWQMRSLAFQPSGWILVGSGPDYDGYPGHSLRRLNMDGSSDPSFKFTPTGPDGEVYHVTPQPDGRILIGGIFTSVSGIPRGGLARLMPDGSLDRTFLEGLSGANVAVCVRDIVLQDDGKILVGGEFIGFNGETHRGIVRLNADGSLDPSFLGYSNRRVYSIGLQRDGKILIGGDFTSVNGISRASIARLNDDGSLDAAFSSSVKGGSPNITTLVLQADGRILLGGDFTTVNGVARSRIARLNVDGTLDGSFLNARLDQRVTSMAVQDDAKIIIGGGFNWVNGVAQKSLARLNADGSLDPTFVPVLPSSAPSVYAINAPGDGKILIGGSFAVTGPLAQLARLNGDGSSDSSFPGALLDLYSVVYCVTLQGDGKILIAGSFKAVNDKPRSYIARLLSDYGPPAVQTPPASQTAEAGLAVDWGVEVDSDVPVLYQWFFNGTNALGDATTNDWLELANVQAWDCGIYTVIVSNRFGSVTSSPAMLNVIAPVNRKLVPGLSLVGQAGAPAGLEYRNTLAPGDSWVSLNAATLGGTPEFRFDLTEPLPPQRFYRAWLSGMPGMLPVLDLHMVPGITLTGNIGDSLRLDYINAIGPTDAWVTLDTVTLTNTSHLYLDVSSIDQPRRLYRIVPVP